MIFQNLTEVEQYLGALPFVPRFRGDERLQYVRQVLHDLGDPQDVVPMIHIAGTSGKGSTAYYAAQIIHASGYTVGAMVSPHVTSVTERTQVNGQLLPEKEYCRYVADFIAQVQPLEVELTYIEFLTVFSYWLFAQLHLDYVVIEVGIGGRLDTTNVSGRSDKVAVITDIGLDHTELLGDTLVEIAGEKAGIITEGGSVVMNPQPSEVMTVIRERARHRHAAFIVNDSNIDTKTPLPSYQRRNSSLALAAVNCRFAVDGKPTVVPRAVHQALSCVIPGRFEKVTIHEGPALLDAAHNPQKIRALVEAYRQAYPGVPCIIVAAFGENKRTSTAESLALLRGISDHLVVTEFSVEGKQLDSIDRSIFTSMAANEGYTIVASCKSPHDALVAATNWARGHNAMVLVTGSFYLISAVRS